MRIVRVRRGPTIPPYYSPDSIFNRPVSDADTLATDQSQAQHAANQIQYGKPGHMFFGYTGVGYGAYEWPYSLGFNVYQFTFPIYAVRPSDPSQRISWQKVGLYVNASPAPYPLGTQYGNIQAYTLNVPIPDKTLCPLITGTAPYEDIWSHGEGGCVIWNVETDEAWEFFELTNHGPATMQSRLGCTWLAQMAGYIPSMTTFNGCFANMWGARGTSLGAVGGVITMEDLRRINAGGSIDHGLCFALAMNGGSGSQVLPATRGDGPGPSGNYFPHIPAGYPGSGQPNPAYQHDVSYEGSRLRFPADVDLSAITTPVGLAIAEAIRDYGMTLVDTTGAAAFYTEDRRTLGSPYHIQGADAVDPWSLTWSGGSVLNIPSLGSGFTVLHELPWDQLQALTPVAS